MAGFRLIGAKQHFKTIGFYCKMNGQAKRGYLLRETRVRDCTNERPEAVDDSAQLLVHYDRSIPDLQETPLVTTTSNRRQIV
jgi:hypothetical protein